MAGTGGPARPCTEDERQLLEAGVTLAVGTDDVNCNGSVNLLSDMKTLALVHRALADDPSALTAEQVLEDGDDQRCPRGGNGGRDQLHRTRQAG